MNWWLRDFDLLGVVLRALVLAWEAIAVGGVLFLLSAGRQLPVRVTGRLRRATAWAAWLFALALAASMLLSAVELAAGGVPWRSVASAAFMEAGECGVWAAVLLALSLPRLPPRSLRRPVWLLLALVLLGSSVGLSHAASRLHGRVVLLLLTAAHHLGTALWIGAMPSLLLALRALAPKGDATFAVAVARAYSRMALVGVPLLVAAGLGLSWAYVGSWAGLYGSSYGVMIMAKTALLLLAGLLGWSNQRLLARPQQSAAGLWRIRGFSEAEIGLGFTAVLAAASLTAQPPAVDLPRADLVSGAAIVERFHPEWPRLASPPLRALTAPAPLAQALARDPFLGDTPSNSEDRAWSEYNHHWAGLVVALAALLALLHAFPAPRSALGRALRVGARQWPLMFLGLAVFVLLRADPENWPLGPRPFWGSFLKPDVLEHRLFAVLIAVFAVFEWRVQRQKEQPASWQAYVFPLLCALGGAALLTHTHGAGEVHEETLAELSHASVAVLGAAAGWGRWLELRLHGTRAARWAAYTWPVCLLLAGLLLVNYRES